MPRTLLSTSSLFSNNASGSSIALPSWSLTAGSLAVIVIRSEAADVTVSVTDSQGVEWTAIKLRYFMNLWVAYAWDHPGGETVVTAAFSAAQTYRKMQGIELSGGDAIDPYLPGSDVVTTGSGLPLNHSVSFADIASVISAQGNFSSSTYGVTSGTKFTGTDGFFCGSYTLSAPSPVVHQNTGGAAASANLSVAFADPVVADTEDPVFTGVVTVVSTGSSTVTDLLPTATDNVAVVGYQGRIDGGAWVEFGVDGTATWTGLSPLTSYSREYRAYDASPSGPNYSATLSITSSTYRAGASAGSIVAATGPQDGNPAGPLYALALTLPVDAWVSYRTVSGPTPSGGTLVAQPNGAFSYTGPSPAVWTIQPEINGVDHTDTVVVTLYDQSSPPSLSTLSRWDGSQMVPGGTSRRWDGTAWVAGGTLRRHNGTTWS